MLDFFSRFGGETESDEDSGNEGGPKRRYMGPPLEEEDRIGCIRAWRGWRVTNDDDGERVLRSKVKDTIWPTPRLEADGPPSARKHKEYKHIADCWSYEHYEHHGIYALKPLECARLFNYTPVVGELDLFGKIVEHSRGYRAEKAVIRKLYLVPGRVESHGPFTLWSATAKDGSIEEGLAEWLAERYDCEVDTELGMKMAKFYDRERVRCRERKKLDEGESEEPAELAPENVRKIVREELRQWKSGSPNELFMSNRPRLMRPRVSDQLHNGFLRSLLGNL